VSTNAQIHLVVRGNVQGVGFRWHVMDAARRLDLAGWVKNRADGAVEVCATGGAEGVAALEREVTSGPRGARVERVEHLDSAPSDDLTKPFSILRDRQSP
jgi:acylphosphatase